MSIDNLFELNVIMDALRLLNDRKLTLELSQPVDKIAVRRTANAMSELAFLRLEYLDSPAEKSVG